MKYDEEIIRYWIDALPPVIEILQRPPISDQRLEIIMGLQAELWWWQQRLLDPAFDPNCDELSFRRSRPRAEDYEEDDNDKPPF